MRQSLTSLLGHHKSRGSLAFSTEDLNERSKRVESRYIATTPYKVLDAPGVLNDYYLNILDWSGDYVAIALRESVFLYNTVTAEVKEVHCMEDRYVSSIKLQGENCYVGDSKGEIQIYDINLIDNRDPDEKPIPLYTIKQHFTRVGSLSINNDILSSGEKEGHIVNTDLRCLKMINKFEGHSQEVCGLKWSPNKDYLASGSNDNTVKIWKMNSPVARTLVGHSSAVKAFDWCKWKSNILCTGGGAKDKTLRVWDIVSGKEIKRVATDSQVCTLNYLTKYKELLTTHGYQQNDLKLWKATGGIKMIKSFGNHEARVLHTAINSDETSVVSLSPDESLKFWKIRESKQNAPKKCSLNIR